MGDKSFIIGCDEVGYGSLAGPLVVVGVRAAREWTLEGLRDSKKLTPKRREGLAQQLEQLIAEDKLIWALAERSNQIIDEKGVYNVLKDCYVEIFHQLYQDDSQIIIDGNIKFDGLGVDAYDKLSVVKADDKYQAVSAASVLAKVYRDKKMHLLHHSYPMYGWDHNVGYWDKDHIAGLNQHGPCPLHRYSYEPVKGMKK